MRLRHVSVYGAIDSEAVGAEDECLEPATLLRAIKATNEYLAKDGRGPSISDHSYKKNVASGRNGWNVGPTPRTMESWRLWRGKRGSKMMRRNGRSPNCRGQQLPTP
jgi:hypothetical protein